MKVLVCDDLKDRYDEVVKAIREAGRDEIEVVPLVGSDLTTELEKLFDNVKACLVDPVNYNVRGALAFDAAELVILDNNLAALDIKGTRLTAESVAGYVRAFSDAPYVVSLNKNPDVDFDLRYLVGDYATRADLALNTNHLANTALWTGDRAQAKNGFLPWYWPKLLKVGGERRKQIAFAKDHLDDPIFSALEIPAQVIDFLSPHAKGVLSPNAASDGAVGAGSIPLDKVTFRDWFLASSRSLPDSEERANLSKATNAGKDGISQIVSRVVAADVDFWFRRDVLGPQEALVDVPHLLMRMPFLLGERAGDIVQWNAAISADAPSFGIDKALFDKHLAKAKFKHDMWVPSASFFWPLLKSDEELDQLFFAAKQDWADAIFCEDRALFVPRSPNGEKSPTIEFVAEFEGSWATRHVAGIDGIRYVPRSRFAL